MPSLWRIRGGGMSERWRPIPIAPSYEASNLGRVRSMRRATPHVMAVRVNRHGYSYVDMLRDGKKWQPMLHRLVASAFLGPLPDGLVTRHLDGDKSNCAASNLRYGTHAENEQDKLAHGTALKQRDRCAQGHLYDERNARQYKQWRRRRTCYSANQRRAYLRRRDGQGVAA